MLRVIRKRPVAPGARKARPNLEHELADLGRLQHRVQRVQFRVVQPQPDLLQGPE